MKEFTDTERLDWALSHAGAEWDYNWQDNIYWIRWFRESHWYTVRGKNFRECIDCGLRGEEEKS